MKPILILSRKIQERIFIGDNIVITLVEMRDGRARIGIECDRSIPIYREEVLERIELQEKEKRENERIAPV